MSQTAFIPSHRLDQPSVMRVLASELAFPEGPAFAPDGSLWAVELKGGALVRWQDGKLERYRVGGSPNGMTFDAREHIWYCDAGKNAICWFDPHGRKTETIIDHVAGHPLSKPNDLAFDRAGNLVFTCPGDSRQEPTGYVCVQTASGDLRVVASGLFFPNGVAFSPSGDELVIAETYRHRLWKGRWNAETAEWINASVWADVEGPNGPGGPDGMAFRADGCLYVAIYGTGKLQVIEPSGRVTHSIDVPGQNPTNCAFDPSGTLGLVVTEAEKGHLFALTSLTSTCINSNR